ncbi:MAG: EAL domain-containing protein [Geobacteraceae bacterium]|nr:EAL domain-containing protein [Geobacteraceae bacterium]
MNRDKFLGQWGVLLLVLLLLAGSIVHNLYKIRTDVLTGEEQRLLAQVRVVNANLSAQLQGTAQVMQHICDELRNLAPDSWTRGVSNRELEFDVHGIAGVRTVFTVDRTGIVRHSNRKLLIGSDVSNEDCFQTAVKNPDPAVLFVTPPFQTSSGVWGMNLVRVMHDADGRFNGIVAATLDPEYFKTLLGSINYSPDMWSALAHGDGVQFMMVPDRPGQQGANLLKPGSFFSRHITSAKRENVLSGTVYSTGESRLMAIYSIQPVGLNMDKPLVVATGRDFSVIFKGWRAHAMSQGITFAIIALVAVAALAGFQRYQREQLHLALEAEQTVQNTKQQLRDIIDFLPDATFVIDNDKKVVIWNRAMEKMTGVPKEEMIGKGDHEYTIPFYGTRRTQLLDLFDVDDEDLKAKYANIRRTGEILDAETFCPALYDGAGAYVWATGVPLYDANGQRIGAIESIRDISERKKNEDFLRKLTHGIEHSASAVLITDLQGTIEYVNKKFTQLTGYSPEEAIGRNPRILKSDVTPREVFDNLWKTILSGQEWRGELLNRRRTGEVYWSIASISPLHNEQGEITHFIANVEDINERKNAEATIERLAYFDPLTDLPNRRMLQDRLDLALRRSRRQATGAALLYLDLDSFKHINDSLGHPAGDKLLREMASRFTQTLRDDDVVCRLGGDEFAVVLHDIRHEQDVVSIAQKLLDTASEPLQLEGREVAVTSSVGIALYPKDGTDAKALGKHADIALYHAKAEGKNTFRFFSEELNNNLRDRMAMEHGLRHVLDRGELELHYQPKVSVANGQVTGVEALLRWNSPEFGLVSPMRFIPLAEETRQIIPIGDWVLRTACRQQLLWQQQGIKLNMAVNLSAVQFKSPTLIERIAALIDETGIQPENLELELTESALVDKPDDAVRVLEQLRSLGCGISIDDFGTGYSSLSYLKNFPVTILKIDRSFVRDLAHDSGDRAIAQSVVSLATNLDMKTVAEGVEEPEQLEILKQIGCTYIQGFIHSRPVPADQIPAVVKRVGGEA